MFRISFIFILLSFFGLFLFNCKHTGPTHTYLGKAKENPAGILFLTFIIRSDSTQTSHIELVKKAVVAGNLKGNPVNSTAEKRIWIHQANDAGIISSVAVNHPLFKHVEYVNDQHEFQSKTVTLKDTEFFARITAYAKTEYILLEEEVEGNIVHAVRFKLKDYE